MATAEKPAEAPDAAAAGAEGQPAEGAAAAERPIIRKIIVEEGHGGAHGGAWKIALADMMTALMAFFLLMWLLGAANADQRKSIADYFRPASHSQIKFGELAGSDGLLGGRSVVDPDGFPNAPPAGSDLPCAIAHGFEWGWQPGYTAIVTGAVWDSPRRPRCRKTKLPR